MRNNLYGQRGFTLVEMALVMMVLGLMLAGVFAVLKPYQAKQKRDLTLQRIERVTVALNDFAQKTGRLPCPAAPDAVPPGVMRADCATDALRDGVVPYTDLGLTRLEVTDGFGNPLTYVVSAALADVDIPPATIVYAVCRQPSWVDNSVPESRNPVKASLCCQDVRVGVNEIAVIADPATGQRAISTQAVPAPLAAPLGSDFDQNSNSYFGQPIDASRAFDYIAYAVISHGGNGELSYLWGQPARRAAQSTPGNAEVENANGNATVVDWQELVGERIERVRNDSTGPNRYDDIVVWKAQTDIVRTARNDSCNKP